MLTDWSFDVWNMNPEGEVEEMDPEQGYAWYIADPDGGDHGPHNGVPFQSDEWAAEWEADPDPPEAELRIIGWEVADGR